MRNQIWDGEAKCLKMSQKETIAARLLDEGVKGPYLLFCVYTYLYSTPVICGEDHRTGPRATTDLENRDAESATGEGEGH